MKYQHIISGLESCLSQNPEYRSSKIERLLFDLSKDKNSEIRDFCLKSLEQIKESNYEKYYVWEIGVRLLSFLENKVSVYQS